MEIIKRTVLSVALVFVFIISFVSAVHLHRNTIMNNTKMDKKKEVVVICKVLEKSISKESDEKIKTIYDVKYNKKGLAIVVKEKEVLTDGTFEWKSKYYYNKNGKINSIKKGNKYYIFGYKDKQLESIISGTVNMNLNSNSTKKGNKAGVIKTDSRGRIIISEYDNAVYTYNRRNQIVKIESISDNRTYDIKYDTRGNMIKNEQVNQVSNDSHSKQICIHYYKKEMLRPYKTEFSNLLRKGVYKYRYKKINVREEDYDLIMEQQRVFMMSPDTAFSLFHF